MKQMHVIFVICAVFALLLFGCAKAKTPGEPAANLQSAEQAQKDVGQKAAAKTFTGSFDDVLKNGKSARCTWESADADGAAEGIFFVKGKKFTQEVRIMTSEGETVTSVLFDGSCTYLWEEGPDGMKMCLSQEQQEQADSVQPPPEHAPGTLQCTEQEVDNSVFLPPDSVIFREVTVPGG